MDLELLVFDLDNTLVDRDGGVSRYFEDLVRVRRPGAFEEPGPERHLARLMDLDGQGYRTREDLARDVLAAYPGLGWSPEEFIEDYESRTLPLVEPFPGVPGMLERLATRYRLAVVTNGSSTRQRAKLGAGDLEAWFEEIVVSGEVGMKKPDPRIFRRVLESTGCAAARSLFVGDHPEKDVEAAGAVGFRTCWVRGRWRGEREAAAPDLVLERVSGLEAALPPPP